MSVDIGQIRSDAFERSDTVRGFDRLAGALPEYGTGIGVSGNVSATATCPPPSAREDGELSSSVPYPKCPRAAAPLRGPHRDLGPASREPGPVAPPRAAVAGLLEIDPGLRPARARTADCWAPEEPPVTVLFGELGDAIAERFGDEKDVGESERDRRVLEHVERGTSEGDEALATAVATGLVEALTTFDPNGSGGASLTPGGRYTDPVSARESASS